MSNITKTYIKNLNINLNQNLKKEFYDFFSKLKHEQYVSLKGRKKDVYCFRIRKNEIDHLIKNENIKNWIDNTIDIIEKKFEIKFLYIVSLIVFPYHGVDPHIDDRNDRFFIFCWPIFPFRIDLFAPVYVCKYKVEELDDETNKKLQNDTITEEERKYYYEKIIYHDNGIMFNGMTWHYMYNNEYFRLNLQLVFK
ncbi:MAG: hypothetical protein NZZ41_00685 [Candidatus Dojkabacteria bacterium]|nr:hypothetical protein [Candidatus Dojkabacteria bacterium]